MQNLLKDMGIQIGAILITAVVFAAWSNEFC